MLPDVTPEERMGKSRPVRVGGVLRPEDEYRVRMEVQGRIEAGAYRIFDSVIQDLDVRDPAVQDMRLSADELVEAGVVLFTRDGIREVFPEWWGAGLPPWLDLTLGVPPEYVRRTTMALQEAIDAAHTRRAFASSRLPIPITLSRTYEIDREVIIGERWWDAERGFRAFPDDAHPTQVRGFVLRGARGPSTAGTGSATIRASTRFFSDDARLLQRGDQPPERVTRVTERSDAVLSVRGVHGWRIEGVTFDANFAASRCVTFEEPNYLHDHNIGIEACTFMHATRELMHLGGEFLRPRRKPSGKKVTDAVLTPGDGRTFNPHFSGQHDLANPRVTRCTFDTGTPDEVRRALERRGLPVVAPVGVVFRAQQTVLLEYHNCAFRGAAAPMFAIHSGRVSFLGSSFHTQTLDPITLNTSGEGVDFMILRTPAEYIDSRSDNPSDSILSRLSAGSLLANDVVSRSPQFIWSFTTTILGQDISGNVVLNNVTHDPILADSDPLPPAIVWGTPGWVGIRLMMSGCTFYRPLLPGRRAVAEPVEVRFADSLTNINDIRTRIGELERSDAFVKGHIVDLGNHVIARGRTVGLLNIAQLGEAAGRLAPDATRTRDVLEAMQMRILQRYSIRS
jgi:hypothetical protein